MNNILEFIADKIMFPFLIILVFLLILCIPICIYNDYKESKSPTFELKKKDWDCTNIHEYDTTMYVMVGKVMVPQVTHHSDCIQWSKK